MDGIYHMTVEMKGPIVIDGVYSVKATYEGPYRNDVIRIQFKLAL